ncbi:MAG: hypothetical protein RR561_05645 [Peptostreptococcus sp.]|uniref:hypothetical protein n=1 Tax=Peptostreptococcus sp. TaxID=1262 RepID=UPI002FC5EFB9
MSEKIKKTNSGKAINFAEKKKAYNNKKSQADTQKNVYNDNRVIQYDINKMREQINQQTKSKNKAKLNRLNSPIWVKAIYAAAIIMFVLLIAGKITNNFGMSSSDGLPDKFVAQSSTISSEDNSKYEKLISSYLNTYVPVDGDVRVVTTSMHKNDKMVYANGYFSYPNEKSKIKFDAVLTDENLSSLIVNGYELTTIKK